MLLCKLVQRRLEDDTQPNWVRRHLDACARCRTEIETDYALSAILRQARVMTTPVSQSNWSQVRARIAETQRSEQLAPPRRQFAFSGAAGALAMCAVAFVAYRMGADQSFARLDNQPIPEQPAVRGETNLASSAAASLASARRELRPPSMAANVTVKPPALSMRSTASIKSTASTTSTASTAAIKSIVSPKSINAPEVLMFDGNDENRIVVAALPLTPVYSGESDEVYLNVEMQSGESDVISF